MVALKLRIKAWMTLLFTLCLCFTMLCFSPVRASAEENQIKNVLASLNYSPVIYMELQYVNVSTSGSGYSITGVSWLDSAGKAVTEQFGKGRYQLQIRYAAADGYRFASDAKGFINNDSTGVTLTVEDDGVAALLTKDFEAEIWTPIAIKDPGNTVIEAGGSTSFVVSSMYTDEDEWYLVDASGHSFTAKDVRSRFPSLECSGENTDKLVLHNVPADMNGWSVFCRHWSVNKISYSDSKKGSITIKGTQPTSASEASAAPEPTPEATASPAAEKPEASPEPEVVETPGPTFKTEWSHDADCHWHDSEDGSAVSAKSAHCFVWRETTAPTAKNEGEEAGICSVCGYTVSRALPAAEGEADPGLGTFRPVLYLIGAAAALGLLSLAVPAVSKSRRK